MDARARRRGLIGTILLAPAASLLATRALAQATAGDGIRRLTGTVLVNGEQASASTPIRPGDRVVTGSDGDVAFTLAADAYFLRAGTEVHLGNVVAGGLIDGLRLVTGALGAAFRRGTRRTVYAPTVTAGIRGTAVYVQTTGGGTYFCTCHGTVELASMRPGSGRLVVQSNRHSSPQLVPAPTAGSDEFVPARIETHSDAEIEALEAYVGRRPPWLGR